jgi:hypothetical protein
MATVASGLNSGSGYNSSDTITSTTLNNHVNNATVTNIQPDDIASSTNKTTGVTFAKMQFISTDKVLARTSSNDGVVEEIDIAGASGILLDEDDLSSDSATRGATQQSIKAYIDAEINKTLGFNQTWQVVTRVINDSTEYTNDTGKPITVRLLAAYNSVGTGSLDDISIDIALKTGGGSYGYIRFIDSIGFDGGPGGFSSDIGQIVIPPNFTYKFRNNNTTALTTSIFHELR